MAESRACKKARMSSYLRQLRQLVPGGAGNSTEDVLARALHVIKGLQEQGSPLLSGGQHTVGHPSAEPSDSAVGDYSGQSSVPSSELSLLSSQRVTSDSGAYSGSRAPASSDDTVSAPLQPHDSPLSDEFELVVKENHSRNYQVLQMSLALMTILDFHSQAEVQAVGDLYNMVFHRDVLLLSASLAEARLVSSLRCPEGAAAASLQEGSPSGQHGQGAGVNKLFGIRLRSVYPRLEEGYQLRQFASYVPFTAQALAEADSVCRLRLAPLKSFYCSEAWRGVRSVCTPSLVLRHTASLQVCEASLSYAQLLGYLPQDLLGTSVFELYHTEDLPHLASIYQQVKSCQGKPFRSDPYRLRTQNGSYVVVETEWSMSLNSLSKMIEYILCKSTVLKGPEKRDVLATCEPRSNFHSDVSGRIQDRIRAMLAIQVPEKPTTPGPWEDGVTVQQNACTGFYEADTTALEDQAPRIWVGIDSAGAVITRSSDAFLSPRNFAADYHKLYGRPSGSPVDEESPPSAGEAAAAVRDSPKLVQPENDSGDSDTGVFPTYAQLNYTETIRRFLTSCPKTYVSDEERQGFSSALYSHPALQKEVDDCIQVAIPVPSPPSVAEDSTKVLVSEHEHGVGVREAREPITGQHWKEEGRDPALDAPMDVCETEPAAVKTMSHPQSVGASAEVAADKYKPAAAQNLLEGLSVMEESGGKSGSTVAADVQKNLVKRLEPEGLTRQDKGIESAVENKDDVMVSGGALTLKTDAATRRAVGEEGSKVTPAKWPRQHDSTLPSTGVQLTSDILKQHTERMRTQYIRDVILGDEPISILSRRNESRNDSYIIHVRSKRVLSSDSSKGSGRRVKAPRYRPDSSGNGAEGKGERLGPTPASLGYSPVQHHLAHTAAQLLRHTLPQQDLSTQKQLLASLQQDSAFYSGRAEPELDQEMSAAGLSSGQEPSVTVASFLRPTAAVVRSTGRGQQPAEMEATAGRETKVDVESDDTKSSACVSGDSSGWSVQPIPVPPTAMRLVRPSLPLAEPFWLQAVTWADDARLHYVIKVKSLKKIRKREKAAVLRQPDVLARQLSELRLGLQQEEPGTDEEADLLYWPAESGEGRQRCTRGLPALKASDEPMSQATAEPGAETPQPGISSVEATDGGVESETRSAAEKWQQGGVPATEGTAGGAESKTPSSAEAKEDEPDCCELLDPDMHDHGISKFLPSPEVTAQIKRVRSRESRARRQQLAASVLARNKPASSSDLSSTDWCCSPQVMELSDQDMSTEDSCEVARDEATEARLNPDRADANLRCPGIVDSSDGTQSSISSDLGPLDQRSNESSHSSSIKESDAVSKSSDSSHPSDKQTCDACAVEQREQLCASDSLLESFHVCQLFTQLQLVKQSRLSNPPWLQALEVNDSCLPRQLELNYTVDSCAAQARVPSTLPPLVQRQLYEILQDEPMESRSLFCETESLMPEVLYFDDH